MDSVKRRLGKDWRIVRDKFIRDTYFGTANKFNTTAAYVDDFVYQSRISRAYSKKNGNIFGDTENMLKDNTLNRIS
jgi:hypothetical protein